MVEIFIRLLAVVKRELKWLLTNRIAFIALFCTPLIALSILTWTLSKSVIHYVDIAVVDGDQSDTSKIITQGVSASPTVSLSHRYMNLAEGSAAVRNGEVSAAVFIPPFFERDMNAGTRPQIIILYNNQYLTAGSAVSTALNRALNSIVGTDNELLLPKFVTGTQLEVPSLGPVSVTEALQGNTTNNYAELLMRSVGPAVLHVTITIIATFSMASEFRRRRGLREVLEVAGGSPFIVILGKSLPLLFIGVVLFLALTAAQNIVYDITIKGSNLMIISSEILLVLAYQGLGMFLALLFKEMPTALSVASVCISPAFGYAGISLPTFSMNTFAKVWSSMLPVRWYLNIFFDQATRGVPVSASMHSFVILAGLAVLYTVIAWWSFKLRSSNKKDWVEVLEEQEPVQCKPNLFSVVKAEIRSIITHRATFSFFIFGPLFYGVFYPQPYLGEFVRKIPIAVIDHENSAISQELIMALSASQSLEIKLRTSALATASKAMDEGEVYAVVEIPVDMTRNVLQGTPSSLPVYADATYFSIHGKVLAGVMETVATFNAFNLSFQGREDSSLTRYGTARISPAEVLAEPLYNPTGGYAAYVAPAAYVLIIQQLLIFGVPCLRPIFPMAAQRRKAIKPIVIGLVGQTVAHTLMITPGVLFLLVIMVRVFGFSTLGHLLDLALMLLPFLLACSLLGQAVGYWLKDGITALVMLVATSLPMFFLAGVAWPYESIPPILRFISKLIPSTVAIDGVVRISQMGAHLNGVMGVWLTLWFLVLLYFCLALLPRIILGKPDWQEKAA